MNFSINVVLDRGTLDIVIDYIYFMGGNAVYFCLKNYETRNCINKLCVSVDAEKKEFGNLITISLNWIYDRLLQKRYVNTFYLDV